MVASEVHPFAKTGGLADVLGALPRALVKLGHHVDVVMPKYRTVSAGQPIGQITVTLGGQVDVANVSAVIDRGVRVVFITHPAYFERDYLMGTERDQTSNQDFRGQGGTDFRVATGRLANITSVGGVPLTGLASPTASVPE